MTIDTRNTEVAALVERWGDRGRELLVVRLRDDGPRTWRLPSGQVRDSERLEDAAVRLVRQQTGLCLVSDGLAFVSTSFDGGAARTTVGVWTSVATTKVEASEPVAHTDWYSFERMHQELVRGEIGNDDGLRRWATGRTRARHSATALSREERWKQLSNVISLRDGQDLILWTIFGIFWAANVLLVGALLGQGRPPDSGVVGFVIALVGVAMCTAWLGVQRRALFQLTRFDNLITRVESSLDVPASLRARRDREAGPDTPIRGPRARTIMNVCCRLAPLLWVLVAAYFVLRSSSLLGW